MRTGCQLLRFVDARQTQQRHAQLRRQNGRERAVRRRFDAQGVNAHWFCAISHTIEQNRLADSTESDHRDALSRSDVPHALDRNANGFDEVIPPGKLGRRRAGARGERVEKRIHVATIR